MAAQPRRLDTILAPEVLTALLAAIEADNQDAFHALFQEHELRVIDELPNLDDDDRDDTGRPLLFFAAGCYFRPWAGWNTETLRQYKPAIVRYLIEHGADIHSLALSTKASSVSREYDRDRRRIYSNVYASVFMNLAVVGDIEAMKEFIALGVNLDQVTEDEDRNPIEGETALELCIEEIEFNDRIIKSIIESENRTVYVGDEPRDIHRARVFGYYYGRRMAAIRGYEFLKGITVKENVKKPFTSRKNYASYHQVLRGAPNVGPYELPYYMSFVRKPATFKVKPTNIGLSKVNTSLFQGGRRKRQTRRRHIRKRN